MTRATDGTTETAREDHGPGLLPVPASRARAVDGQVDEWFADLSYHLGATHVRDQEGRAHGTTAANRAPLRGQGAPLSWVPRFLPAGWSRRPTLL